MKRLLLILAMSCAFAGTLAAQDVRVAATVDSNRFMIGQWITVHLRVDAPTSIQVKLPDSDDDVENGDYVFSQQAEQEQGGKGRAYRQDVVATVFDTGSIALRIRVRYTQPGDTTVYETFSNALRLEITTVALDTSQTFKDIKDVLDISLTIWDYLLYLAIVLLLAGAAWYAYRRWKNRPERPVEISPDPVPDIPPHVLALEALAALRAKRLWQNGEHKAYQSELTDILRAYVEQRYRIPAMEHPTSEIMPSMAVLGLAPSLLERFERVLRTADLTKFARYTPTSMQHEEGMSFAEEFIQVSIPAAALSASVPEANAQTKGSVTPITREEEGGAPDV